MKRNFKDYVIINRSTHNRLSFIKFLLIVCSILLTHQQLHAQDTIKWQVVSNSPSDDVNGVENKFYFSMVREIYMQNIIEIKHTKEHVPFKRALHRIENGYKGCLVGIYKTKERENKFYS